MTSQRLEILMRRALPWFFTAIFVWTMVLGYRQIFDQNVWTVGDWLINYQAGFVRRGLLGEGLLRLGAILSLHPSWLVIGVYAVGYGAFLGFSYLLLRRQKNLLPYTFLIVSPALFLFQVYDVQGGFRKEILIFGLLALLVFVANTRSTLVFERVFFGIIAFFPLVILTHEMLAIWLPYFFIVLVYRVRLTRKHILISLVLIALNMGALWLSFRYSGDFLTAVRIAMSLSYDGTPWLNGAIKALARDFEASQARIQVSIANDQIIPMFSSFAILTILAFLPVWRQLFKVFAKPINLVLLLASLAGTVLLFTAATDWGRFIYIHAVSLFFLTFLAKQKTQNTTPTRLLPVAHMAGAFFIVMLYAGAWFLPHHPLSAKKRIANYPVMQAVANGYAK